MKNTALIVLLISVFFSCSSKEEYVEYKPIIEKQDNAGIGGRNENKGMTYIEGKSTLDEETFTNTKQLLDYYKEPYQVKDGNILLISKKLSDNKELLYNYSSKSRNKEWLEGHKVQ